MPSKASCKSLRTRAATPRRGRRKASPPLPRIPPRLPGLATFHRWITTMGRTQYSTTSRGRASTLSLSLTRVFNCFRRPTSSSCRRRSSTPSPVLSTALALPRTRTQTRRRRTTKERSSLANSCSSILLSATCSTTTSGGHSPRHYSASLSIQCASATSILAFVLSKQTTGRRTSCRTRSTILEMRITASTTASLLRGRFR
mmetsp:Transcript_8499/g.21105  ORF Transcript_8499/g.21105 Transcript_8499/m.21105 type:complete len:201 (+) Transcript_8499:170-772(+)